MRLQMADVHQQGDTATVALDYDYRRYGEFDLDEFVTVVQPQVEYFTGEHLKLIAPPTWIIRGIRLQLVFQRLATQYPDQRAQSYITVRGGVGATAKVPAVPSTVHRWSALQPARKVPYYRREVDA